MSVYIHLDRCVKCGACYRQCPNDVFGWNEEENAPFIAYPDECSHCGVCALECKTGAIYHTIPLACYDDFLMFEPSVNKPKEFNWRKYIQGSGE